MGYFTVGSLDSGIGGLSVLSKVRDKLPNHQYIHFADYDFFPYGVKNPAKLNQRLIDLAPKFVNTFDIDILILACNTASTSALHELRKHLKIPIVGVVPAIKPAAEWASGGKIGVLATNATIKNPYTHELVETFASRSEVIYVGSHELVNLAERKLQKLPVHIDRLRDILKPFSQHACHHVVLACTHFPFLEEEMKTILSPRTKLFDSGEAIARRVAYILGEKKSKSGSPQENLFISSSQDMGFQNYTQSFKSFHFENIFLNFV